MLPFPLTAITNNLFDFLGKTGWSIFSDIVGIFLLMLCFWFITFENVAEFSMARGLVGLAAFALLLIYAQFTIGLSLLKMFTVLVVPFLAASCMYIFFSLVYLNVELTFVGLIINMIIGVIIYSIALFSLMFIAKNKMIVWAFWYERLSSIIQMGIGRLKGVH